MDRMIKIVNGVPDFDCDKCPRKGNCDDSADCVDVLTTYLAKYEKEIEAQQAEITLLRTQLAEANKQAEEYYRKYTYRAINEILDKKRGYDVLDYPLNYERGE